MRLGAYLALVCVGCTLVAWGAVQALAAGLAAVNTARPMTTAAMPGRAAPLPQPSPVSVSQGRVLLTQDDWHERIRSKDFWAGRGTSQPGGQRSDPRGYYAPRRETSLYRDRDDSRRGDSWSDDSDETYRTVCVRLCDGYFWPISFATSRDGFQRDQASCERSCGSPAKLFVYRNPGGEPDEMVSVDQEPYTKLPTAFLFRTKYVPQCRCGPQPWEREALDRHALYNLEAAQRKGDKTAPKQIADLRARQEADRRRQVQQRTAAIATIRAGSLAAWLPIEAKLPSQDEPPIAMVARGEAYAVLAPVQSRPPQIASVPLRTPPSPLPPVAPAPRPIASLPPATTPPAGRTASLPPGNAIIMRLGVGNAQHDVSRKSDAEPKRSKSKRRDRPGA
ncbi:MAG: DUF2865 domain-containing protein [Hyphomicrobiaceae bacterium]